MRWDLWRGGETRARIAASREAEVRAAAESRQAYSSAVLEIRRAHALYWLALRNQPPETPATAGADQDGKVIDIDPIE